MILCVRYSEAKKFLAPDGVSPVEFFKQVEDAPTNSNITVNPVLTLTIRFTANGNK